MEYLKKIKEIRKYWVFKLLGLDVVSKEWGCKRNKDMFWNSSYFLIIHDNTEFGKFGKLSSEGAKNEEHRSKNSSCNLIRSGGLLLTLYLLMGLDAIGWVIVG